MTPLLQRLFGRSKTEQTPPASGARPQPEPEPEPERGLSADRLDEAFERLRDQIPPQDQDPESGS